MTLIIEDNDESFRKYFLSKIELLAESPNPYITNLYTYIQEHNFTVTFVKTDRSDFRGEALKHSFAIHKTKYETYDSLCWIFFHELGHLLLIDSPFENVFECAKATYYAEHGFNHKNGVYWSCDNYYNYYNKHHDEDPEEWIVSMFATYIIGINYDRTWWNKQKEN